MKFKFRPVLFWDTNPKKIDTKKNAQYIIERILKFGDFDDYYWMRSMYSTNEIKNVILQERSDIDPKSINFWCHNFNIEESLCTKKLLAKTQELFWEK